MFSRRTPDAKTEAKAPTAGPADSRPEAGPGKGRPTPTRKEAEQRRREAAKGPARSGKAGRKALAAERAERLEAIKRGDERYLPNRDKGPVRALVRDLVDVRFSASEFFLPMAVLVLLCSVVGSKAAVAMATNIWALMFVVIAFDLVVINRKIRREVGARFPDEPRRGLGMYAMMRSLTWRKMRTPAPRVARGDKL